MTASLVGLSQIFLHRGLTTFGSGNTTSVLLRDDLVARGWLTHPEYNLCFVLARLAPGTNLLALCAALGWKVLGWRGAAAAVGAVAGPAAAVVVLLTVCAMRMEESPVGRAALNGAMTAVVALIVGGVWLLARPYLRPRRLVRTLTIAGAAFVLVAFWGLSPFATYLLAGAAGALWVDQEDL